MTGTATASSSSAAANQWAHLSFVEVLEDLSSRFIVNLPSEELQRIERICFQVEQAHWFYEDFLRPLNSSLPSLNLRKFSVYILQTASLSVPLIRQYVSSGADANQAGTVQDLQTLGGATYGLEEAFDQFMKYKTRVPVCGAVLLTDDLKSCLLVKGWKSSSAWGFPKGKINQSEPPRDCAVRETLEETGFDCSALLSTDSKDWMELNVREQKMRLYIVPGVPKDTVFETQTRKEISKIAWFKLSDLPTWKQSHATGQGGLASANAGAKFYLVTPFIGKLKQWIRDNKVKAKADQKQAAPKAPSPKEQLPTKLPTEPAAMRAANSGKGAESTLSGPLFSDPTSTWPISQTRHISETPSDAAALHRSAGVDDSANLLAMLKASLHVSDSSKQQPLAETANLPLETHSRATDSPLPAPIPQKSSQQTMKLLEMLAPQPSNTAPMPQPRLAPEEEERAKRREALLNRLLADTSSANVSPGLVHPSQQFIGPPPVAGQDHFFSKVSSPSIPTNPTFAPPSPDSGRSSLLNMLNSGPLQPSAREGYSQQQRQAFPLGQEVARQPVHEGHWPGSHFQSHFSPHQWHPPQPGHLAQAPPLPMLQQGDGYVYSPGPPPHHPPPVHLHHGVDPSHASESQYPPPPWEHRAHPPPPQTYGHAGHFGTSSGPALPPQGGAPSQLLSMLNRPPPGPPGPPHAPIGHLDAAGQHKQNMLRTMMMGAEGGARKY